MSNADRLLEVLGTVFAESETRVDAAVVERMVEALSPITAPDVVTVMAGPDDAFVAEHEGPGGIRDAWADWLDSFASVRFEIEGVERIADNVLVFGRQMGISRIGGVEIEQPSAAVWKFRDDLLQRIEFHLSRDKALASAREPAG
jgi:SnoaL-like domain